jgi:hypothetical protein
MRGRFVVCRLSEFKELVTGESTHCFAGSQSVWRVASGEGGLEQAGFLMGRSKEKANHFPSQDLFHPVEHLASWTAVALYRYVAAGEVTPRDRTPTRSRVTRGAKPRQQVSGI